MGLVLKSKAKHHAISSNLIKPFHFSNKKPLVIQYEVKFQSPMECGGAYVKLLADEANFNLENFYDKTSFSVMFGPDKCGTENKYHFIIRYKHPIKGTYEEHHAKKVEIPDTFFTDGKTHLYTLIVKPDNTYRMSIDLTEINAGSLLSDLTPAINPPKEIVDPNDSKPESWDDREKIPDPDAVKPEDWDEEEPKLIPDPNAKMPEGWLEEETETIPDPVAVKPEDWDDSTDGDWEAPKIDNPKCKDVPGCGKWTAPMLNNPKYKGKWKAPLIENTNYQGKWEPKKIPNPDFFEDLDPFSSLTSFAGIGLELWSLTDNIYFDNFIISDDESVAAEFAKDSWEIKKRVESISSSSSDSVIESLVKAANDKPWLWAVYLLVVLLPIVVIVVFVCGGKSSDNKKKDAAAKAKKTDEPVEDDAKEEDGEENENQQEANQEEEEEEVRAGVDKSDLEPKGDDGDEPVEENVQKSPKKRRAKRID